MSMRLSRPLASAARQVTKGFLAPAGIRSINLAAGSDVPNMRYAKRPCTCPFKRSNRQLCTYTYSVQLRSQSTRRLRTQPTSTPRGPRLCTNTVPMSCLVSQNTSSNTVSGRTSSPSISHHLVSSQSLHGSSKLPAQVSWTAEEGRREGN